MEQLLYLIKAFAATTIAATVNYFLPLQSFIAITFCLVCADLVTGIQAARARGEAVQSIGLRRTATKFTMYSFAILAAHGVQNVYLKDFPLVFTIAAYIGVTEFWSLLENVGTVTGTDVLGAVRDKLTTILKKK